MLILIIDVFMLKQKKSQGCTEERERNKKNIYLCKLTWHIEDRR